MTPAARYQAAIEAIDRILAGDAAEKVLTSWARSSRFAGSKDRAAVRDHVFDILRKRRSTAALGGGVTGRAHVLGLLREQGIDPDEVFTGMGHAPAVLTEAERTGGRPPEPGGEAWDLPDWLVSRFESDLGEAAGPTARALRARAGMFLRVNTLKASRDQAVARLAEGGIVVRDHPLAPTAMEVVEGARQVARSGAFENGLVELQDAASQAVVEVIPAVNPANVLDYCAGGGGKTLALAARFPEARIVAHDADPGRMSDLPKRARRASAQVSLSRSVTGVFDLVFADVPCSGSGAWRRSPEGKWRFDENRLAELKVIQQDILRTCAARVADGGCLTYATCSVLRDENAAQIEAFLRDVPGWQLVEDRQFLPSDGGDGFFVACLLKE